LTNVPSERGLGVERYVALPRDRKEHNAKAIEDAAHALRRAQRVPAGRRVTGGGTWWPWLIAMLVALLVGFISFAIPNEGEEVAISADIRHAGATTVTFAERLGQATSPACGCYRDDPPGGWQGITMPARELTFGRSRDASPTQFDIFSPDPAQWNVMPLHRGIRARIGIVPVRLGTDPTARVIQRALAKNRNALGPENTDVFTILTQGALHAASFGREPVAALGVPAQVPAQINFTGATSPTQDRTLMVTAPFAPSAQRSGDMTDSIPVLDVLGPRVMVWAPTNLQGPFRSAIRTDPPNPTGEDRSVEASQFEVSFANRLKNPNDSTTLYTVMVVDTGLFALRIVPRPGLDDGWTTVDDLPEESGQMLVTVPQAASQADALVPIFRAAERQPRVTVTRIPVMTDETQVDQRLRDLPKDQLWVAGSQEFDLPPAPPESGVNVFGQISELQLAEARGDLTTNTKPIAIRARTPFELRNIRGVGVVNRRILVPIRLDANTAKIQVTGTAEARLNGLPLAESEPLIKRVVSSDVVLLICTIAAAILAAIGVAQTRRQ
jgi:hypothetical protein